MSVFGERSNHCKAGTSSGGVNHNNYILDFDWKAEAIVDFERKSSDKERRDCLFIPFHSIEDERVEQRLRAYESYYSIPTLFPLDGWGPPFGWVPWDSAAGER